MPEYKESSEVSERGNNGKRKDIKENKEYITKQKKKDEIGRVKTKKRAEEKEIEKSPE